MRVSHLACYGNTSAGSIPLALDESVRGREVRSGCLSRGTVRQKKGVRTPSLTRRPPPPPPFLLSSGSVWAHKAGAPVRHRRLWRGPHMGGRRRALGMIGTPWATEGRPSCGGRAWCMGLRGPLLPYDACAPGPLPRAVWGRRGAPRGFPPAALFVAGVFFGFGWPPLARGRWPT